MAINGTREFDIVTGAFGYTGRYIAKRLLNSGRRVRTLTGHLQRTNPFGPQMETARLNFGDRAELVRSLQGAAVLYNTYWVRFNHGSTNFDNAVKNSRVLIDAASEAGVRKIVHLSIANPSADSPFPYYAGKSLVEQAIVESGLAYAILRPTVIFGVEDILINNIAWFTRHFPIFAIPGSGKYQLQPIYVEDLAEMAITCAADERNLAVDAVGPEILTFEEMVREIALKVSGKQRIVHLDPGLTLLALRVIGRWIGDVVLTREEIGALMANLLISKGAATGHTCFSAWLVQNAAVLGRQYASELRRHFR